MSSLRRHLPVLLKRFAVAAEGVAVVEFALIVPLLLLLYLGSIEASSLYTTDRRITIISSTMGDLIARWEDPDVVIPEATLGDYFSAAEVIMTPYDPDGLEQVVSLIWINGTTGVTKVLWSRANGTGASPRPVNSTYPLAATTEMNEIARSTTATGGWLVVSETSYDYTPALALAFQDVLNLSHTSYFLPRFRECLRVLTGGVTSACS